MNERNYSVNDPNLPGGTYIKRNGRLYPRDQESNTTHAKKNKIKVEVKK